MSNIIMSSHRLAKELLKKEDDFITITIDEKEYVIECIKKTKITDDEDDSSAYLTLVARDCLIG